MSYNLLFQKAMKFHDDGQIDDAEKIYRQLLEIAPKNPDLLNLLGLIAEAKNIHNEAVNLFYQAIKLAPNHAPFHFNLGVSLSFYNKPFEAIEAFKKVLKISPKVFQAYGEIAQIYINMEKKEQAIQYFKKSLEIEPNYAFSEANLAFLEENFDDLYKLKKKYPTENIISYYLSLLLEKAGDYKEALEIILQSNNKNEKMFFQIGRLYEHKKEFIDAKIAYEKALECFPLFVPAIINLANIETNLNNFEVAENLYKKALDIDIQNIDAHINYGNLLYITKELHRSLEEYRKAIIINPEIPEISNNIGIIQRDFKDYDEALGLFFNALSKNPENETFSINIFETLLLLSYEGEKEKALKIAENWKKSMPKNVFANHIYFSLSGISNPNITEYSQKLFDVFADSYEKTLKNIEYSLIDEVRSLELDIQGKVLDLGCGTGLLAELIKRNDNELFGVDISNNMLKIADKKKVYQELIREDIHNFLDKNNDFEWFFALDSLVYVSGIEKIIELCKKGKVCFSFEVLENSLDDFLISEAGRYKYNPEYIEKLFEKYDYKDIKQHFFNIRVENNKPVRAVLFYSA